LPGGSFRAKSRRLAWRIIPRKIPPACPADRSASDYITGSPSPKIPPAQPADRSASDYITGSPSPRIPPARPADHSAQNPAGLPGGSFGFRLHHRLALSQNPAGSPGGWFGFRLHHRLAHRNLLSRRRAVLGRLISQAAPAYNGRHWLDGPRCNFSAAELPAAMGIFFVTQSHTDNLGVRKFQGVLR
jgi:hypothetical protein